MGTTVNSVYIPSANETNWDVAFNAGLTTLANAHITARNLFVPAMSMQHSTGALAGPIGSFPNAALMHNLSASATQTVTCTFALPADAATGSLVVRPLWAAAATDGTAHTIRWSMDYKRMDSGLDITSAGTTTPWTGDSATRTTSLSVLETGASTSTTFAASNVIRLNLSRLGADALDTMTQLAYLLGVRIDYTNL